MAIDKKFIEKFCNVTSRAALAASYLVGKKDKIATDQAAVDSMRSELNKINMNGQVVIGEGLLIWSDCLILDNSSFKSCMVKPLMHGKQLLFQYPILLQLQSFVNLVLQVL